MSELLKCMKLELSWATPVRLDSCEETSARDFCWSPTLMSSDRSWSLRQTAISAEAAAVSALTWMSICIRRIIRRSIFSIRFSKPV